MRGETRRPEASVVVRIANQARRIHAGSIHRDTAAAVPSTTAVRQLAHLLRLQPSPDTTLR